jgi:hypothetical protein
MAAGSVSPFEKHVEKAVLGASFLFLLAMIILYGARSPNRIEYGGQKTGPNELVQAIARDTETLQAAIRKARPPAVEVPDYSEQLRQQQAAGVFLEREGPTLPQQLPVAAEFGRPIPALEEEEAAGADIALVTPLAPSTPVVRAGRSLLIRQPRQIGPPQPSEAEKKEAEKPPEPTETAWVSIAAYFDRKQQEAAMTAARYATAYARVYVAGVEVQRQELLADGQWSDWKDLISPAMPRLEIPTPLFDELTGSVLNKAEINRAFGLLRANQAMLLQPPFYQVVSGDEWRMPPLEGYPDKEPAATRLVADRKKEKKEEPKGESRRPAVSRPKAGGGAVIVGGGAATPAAPKPGADERAAARERAQEDLQAAKKAYKERRDDEALQAANRVISNEHATAAEKREARKIVGSIELVRKQEAKAGQKPAVPVPAAATPGGVPVEVEIAGMKRKPPAAGQETAEQKKPADEQKLTTHPNETGKVAIWFHDDTVEPGKTYRYRMRVKLWNRYFGRPKALHNPAQARQVVLAGEWSPPGEPVTVPPTIRFFIAGADMENHAARVDVWKWHKGEWRKASFTVGVGDVIGAVQTTDSGILDRQTLKELKETVDFTTGAVVLDLRFDEPVLARAPGARGEFSLREAPSLVLVYLDPADGQVKQRFQVLDRSDPFVLERKREAEEL